MLQCDRMVVARTVGVMRSFWQRLKLILGADCNQLAYNITVTCTVFLLAASATPEDWKVLIRLTSQQFEFEVVRPFRKFPSNNAIWKDYLHQPLRLLRLQMPVHLARMYLTSMHLMGPLKTVRLETLPLPSLSFRANYSCGRQKCEIIPRQFSLKPKCLSEIDPLNEAGHFTEHYRVRAQEDINSFRELLDRAEDMVRQDGENEQKQKSGQTVPNQQAGSSGASAHGSGK